MHTPVEAVVVDRSASSLREHDVIVHVLHLEANESRDARLLRRLHADRSTCSPSDVPFVSCNNCSIRAERAVDALAPRDDVAHTVAVSIVLVRINNDLNLVVGESVVNLSDGEPREHAKHRACVAPKFVGKLQPNDELDVAVSADVANRAARYSTSRTAT